MIKLFAERIRQKESRRFFVVYLVGKMLGVGLALLGAKYISHVFLGSPAAAADGDLPQTDLINATNTMWTLVAAFLVFFMQAGFMALEAGFARSRESVNIMMECIFDTCLCGLLYFAIGFAFSSS